MDPRSPYLHQNQNRYAAPQPQSQPRPHNTTNNFHNNNTNNNLHHHSPLPSSASPLPLRPPPPPPPTQFHPQYNPQNPSFAFNSNFNHPRSHPDFIPSPRVFHPDDDYSRRLQDNNAPREPRDSSRVSSDRWPPEQRPYASSNLNPDQYRRPLPVSPMKVNSRFIEERSSNVSNVVRQGDEVLMRRGGGGADENYHRRLQFGAGSERSSRDFRNIPNQMNHRSPSSERSSRDFRNVPNQMNHGSPSSERSSRDFRNVPNQMTHGYDNSRGLPYDDEVSEKQRWARDRDREVSADSFIDKGIHEVGGASERIHTSSKRDNYRSREVIAVELERHSGKGSREGSFEYNRTPRKQQQKKSALLRLQKPYYRNNREDERAQYYFDDSKSTSFRVKDQNLYPHRGGMEQQARAGSPVELDVSFKSNSLVAKAVVTPSSSSAGVSDSDSTPRSAKIRKVLFRNKDSSSSSLIRNSEQPEKLDYALSVANGVSHSDTGLNQPKEEGTASGTGDLRDIISGSASTGTKSSLGKSKMETATKGMVSKKDGINNVASAKTSSAKVAKKKKIVKRVVKKVVTPNMTSSRSLPTKKCDETVTSDSLDHGQPDSSEPEKAADMASAKADSQLCLDEILPIPQNDKVDEVGNAAAFENGAVEGFGSLCVPKFKRKWSDSTSPMGSTSHEEAQNNTVNGNSAISNADKDSKFQNEASCPDVDEVEDVDKQQFQHDDSLLLEHSNASRSPHMLLPFNGNADIGFPSLEKIKILECQPSSYNPTSMSIDDVSANGSLNFMTSTGVSEEDTSNSKMSEENVETSQVKLLNSEVNDVSLDPVNTVHPAYWVDTTLRLSFKDSTNFSGDAGVQPCRDVGRVSPLESSIDVSEDFIAPPKQKQRRLSGSQLKLSCRITSDVSEKPIISDMSVSSGESPSSSGGSLTGPEAEAREASVDPLNVSDSSPLQKNNIASLANCSGVECHSTVASVRGSFDNNDVRSVLLSSTTEELAVTKAQPLYPSRLEAEQIADVTTVLAGSTHQDTIYLESDEVEKMDVDAADAKAIIDSGTGQCEFPSEIESSISDKMLPTSPLENESCHCAKNDLPSVSKYLSSPRDGNGVPGTNSSIEVLGLVPVTFSDTNYVEMLPDVPSTLDSQLPIEKVHRDDEILGQLTTQGGPDMFPRTSDPLNADISINLDHAVENAHSFSGKTGTLSLMDSKNSSQTPNATSEETYGSKNQPNQVSRTFGRSEFATSKKAASSAHLSKPRTWHRADNVSASAPPEKKAVSAAVPKQRQLSRNVSKSQSTSYIRKGNSLVRKPTVVASQSQGLHSSHFPIHRLNSLGTDVKKSTDLENRTLAAEPPNLGRKMLNVTSETPRTPPLPPANKTPNHSTGSMGDHMASPATEPVHNFDADTSSGRLNVAASNDVPKSSEDAKRVPESPMREIGRSNNCDSHNELNDGNAVSSNAIITYVKRKSNQLVAASNHHLSINNSIDTSAAPSDGYYKRRKNQLIRTPLESQVELMASFPDGSTNSDVQALRNSASSKNLTKRQLRKVATKIRKPSKFSLVWTLRSSQLSSGNGHLVHRQKVWPHLFPWKRATYLKNSVPNVATSSISSSPSTMSRKLLLMRKRDTLYTRSKHGFSLRKSKVLSVGGASLKWSKSLERQSKKANEEATLAVAEAERKKREQSGASHFVSGNKNSSSRKGVHNIKLHTGDQIFRIGSVCYRMDSSRRTLQRVSDGDSSYAAACQSEKDAKIPYVPRRLVIGKDEYVRIGNGNQLVRDPKKRTRILANEKVRWSLHTARSRLARRRKYCQFFTRFGKCNKDCKLTHKVIPERMPDCSYFLQGICSNENCPYRHVHVNPNASTCDGFLRGYCADGDECRKKHSYVCPAYEATGSCPQGSKCKLHHPKNRTKGKKSKQSRDKKTGQGRYFGSMQKNVSEHETRASRKCPVQDDSSIYVEGGIDEYISLDFKDEGGESSNIVDEEMYINDSDPLDLQLVVDDDDMIKPIRIMKMADGIMLK
ncbi:Zinc finger C-x8-C-x5-C-x3-H type family protein [Euphorbia peplus]|nr:Zinc finger C-x8-C-x5-C-x3-H type family protein [Euphorbia peplus]